MDSAERLGEIEKLREMIRNLLSRGLTAEHLAQHFSYGLSNCDKSVANEFWFEVFFCHMETKKDRLLKDKWGRTHPLDRVTASLSDRKFWGDGGHLKAASLC